MEYMLFQVWDSIRHRIFAYDHTQPQTHTCGQLNIYQIRRNCTHTVTYISHYKVISHSFTQAPGQIPTAAVLCTGMLLTHHLGSPGAKDHPPPDVREENPPQHSHCKPR